MPNPSELERMAQENEEFMTHVSGTLNRDAFAYQIIEEQIKEQERIAKYNSELTAKYRLEAEVYEAGAKTAQERAASLRDTLSRMERPRG